MINTPPSERPQPAPQPQQQSLSSTGAFPLAQSLHSIPPLPLHPAQSQLAKLTCLQLTRTSAITTLPLADQAHRAISTSTTPPRHRSPMPQPRSHSYTPTKSSQNGILIWYARPSPSSPPNIVQPTNTTPRRNGTPTPSSTPAACSPPSSSPPSAASTTPPHPPTPPSRAHTTASPPCSPTPPQIAPLHSLPSVHHRGTRAHANSRCRDMRGGRRISGIRAVMGWGWGI